jgi:hypothetical protein
LIHAFGITASVGRIDNPTHTCGDAKGVNQNRSFYNSCFDSPKRIKTESNVS